MNPSNQNPNDATVTQVYALRIVGAARTDIDEGREYVEASSGKMLAEAWEDGLFDVISQLAVFPYRYALAPEAVALGLPVRGFSYRRPFTGSTAPAYRVLYLVDDDTNIVGDGPTVTVLLVRHASRRPLTRREGRERRQKLDE